MSHKFSVGVPCDEHYRSKALENGVQAVAHPRKIGQIYALNGGGATVYLLVSDDDAGPHGTAAKTGTIYPIEAGNYEAIATHGGDQMEYGLYLGAYSTVALAVAGGAPDAGNVMFYKVDYGAGYLPQ